MNIYAILLAGVTLASIGQISWKLGMNQVGKLAAINFETLSGIVTNPYVLLGFVLYGIGTIFWLLALSKKDLTFVYPFISLTYVLVLAMSHLLLKESIGLNKIAGTILIILGLIIISIDF